MPSGNAVHVQELQAAIDRLPRVQLAQLPTPLEALPRLSQALGRPVWIKRDDCTGLAFGGNKARHHEFLLGLATSQGADTIVWGAGAQSNNCRQMAAACAKLGLDCHLFLSKANTKPILQGNLLLDYLFGAKVQLVEAIIGPELNARLQAEAAKLQAQGKRTFHWDPAVVMVPAAISYVLCALELHTQLRHAGLSRAACYISSGGSTGAGFVLGMKWLCPQVRVRVISPICWPWNLQQNLSEVISDTAAALGLHAQIPPHEIDATEAYVEPGYGKPSPSGMEATRLLAQHEGILLDPIYTAKALAAAIDDHRQGRLPPDEPIVLIHTGGTPALFAYAEEFIAEFASG